MNQVSLFFNNEFTSLSSRKDVNHINAAIKLNFIIFLYFPLYNVKTNSNQIQLNTSLLEIIFVIRGLLAKFVIESK